MVFLVILLDQISKAFALRYLSTSPSIPIIENIFHLTFVRNTGIAFGLLQNNEFILTVSIFVCVVLLLLISLRLRNAKSGYQWAYGLVMGGALSNFIDRLRLGYVLDFLDFQIWPVFNIADSCITVGMIILMLFTVSES